MTAYRIAADIGGTFTDIACLAPDGSLSTYKLSSTPGDYAEAILNGIAATAAGLGIGTERIDEVLHASTVATNAILEGKGAKTALITTAGFRDVLELRRIRVPALYDPLYCKPPPLVPRRLRFEVAERMGPRGEVIVPLDIAGLEALAAQLAESDVAAVAVCFLHSYANPAHEKLAAEILRRMLPDRFLSISSEVLPEIREYERTSTTVVNAYVGPVVTRYLSALRERLRDRGLAGRLSMMQSGGGALDVERILARPALVVESGPAAGVIGAARVGGAAGYADLITFDMGGTTAKASMIEGGRVSGADDYEVGGGISHSSRLARGGGYALKLPVIDVSEVGAGGGSIVRVDGGGVLKIGPQSAGAVPGPVCYDAGGEEPTVTDANLVLGYLNPHRLAGGAVPLNAERARHAIAEKVAAPLGLDLLQAAYGIHRLANVSMMRAVKAVSTHRGRDPRDFALFAFGGNGGIHAAALATELDMRRIIVPPGAGVFSAVGLLHADFEVAHSASFLRSLDAAVLPELEARFLDLEAKVLAELPEAEARLIWRAELRYEGQGFELAIDVERGGEGAPDLASLRTAFETEHLRRNGHVLEDHRVDIVTLRVTGILLPPDRGPLRPSLAAAPAGQTRPVYFGPDLGLRETPVIGRGDLARDPRSGPCVIEESDCAILVPPGAEAALDAGGNVVITLGMEAV
jgi:N-methylhydantoinase A